jgi:alkylation response protein AidB-like acyl-CoA dehydrogenase
MTSQIPPPSPAKGLFLGSIDESTLFPFPQIKTEEQETVRLVLDSITKFMEQRGEEYREHDRKGAQPEEYLQELRELGLFGIIIPEEYGGLGLSNSAYSRVLQQTSRYDGSTSLTIGAHSSIGMKGLLLFGNADQRSRYLPKLASGETIAAFCLTEPGSGSDAASIKTSAKKQPDGSWVLDGEKIWITNGAFAGFFTVFARTDSEGGKLSAFIVERGFQGVSTGPKEDKMGIRASATTTVRFDGVRIPAANLLGEEGQGFRIAMAILNNGRTGLGGGTVGAMKRCIALASEYAGSRKQFGRPIAEFGLVQEMIARMTVACFATESVVSMVGSLIDRNIPDYSVEAAISKIFASEALWQTANDALQIAGGNGFMREYPYELIVRDSRINLIFEGTNQILRLYVALSGFKDAGEYLKEIGKGASSIFNDPIKGFGLLSGYAGRKLRQISPLREGIPSLPAELHDEGAVMQYYTTWLSRACEAVLRKYGKDIIGRQFVSQRIANVAIDLFVGVSVLSRVAGVVNAQGATLSQDELRIAKIFTQQAKRRMNQNLRRIERDEDNWMSELSNSVVKTRGYRWDTI